MSDLVWWKGEDVPRPVRVIDETAARQVTLFLSDPMARLPSFPRLGPAEFDFPVAVKTGTSQDYRDAWTMAYSPQFLVGVWVGRADAAPMREVSGMASAAPLARDILLALHRHSGRTIADLSFPTPRGSHTIEVCTGPAQRACFAEHVEIGRQIEGAPVVLVDRLTEGNRADLVGGAGSHRLAARQYAHHPLSGRACGNADDRAARRDPRSVSGCHLVYRWTEVSSCSGFKASSLAYCARPASSPCRAGRERRILG
jgi:membrane peptidoglycan carboxypeptidase